MEGSSHPVSPSGKFAGARKGEGGGKNQLMRGRRTPTFSTHRRSKRRGGKTEKRNYVSAVSNYTWKDAEGGRGYTLLTRSGGGGICSEKKSLKGKEEDRGGCC